MVYALKSYSNKQSYRRIERDGILDSFIRKLSNEPTAVYTTRPTVQKPFIDRSVQKLAVNSIIEGYFPKENVVRQMAIKRVNKMLSIIIGLLIGVVVVSYYFVITYEMKLNDLSRQTVILNNENSDLQNQLDSLKSFSNVDKTFQKNNMLKRAGQVIETPEVIVDSQETTSIKKNTKRKIFNYAIGF